KKHYSTRLSASQSCSLTPSIVAAVSRAGRRAGGGLASRSRPGPGRVRLAAGSRIRVIGWKPYRRRRSGHLTTLSARGDDGSSPVGCRSRTSILARWSYASGRSCLVTSTVVTTPADRKTPRGGARRRWRPARSRLWAVHRHSPRLFAARIYARYTPGVF